MEDASEVYVTSSTGLNKFIFDSIKYRSIIEESHYEEERSHKIPRQNKVISLFDECLNFIAIHLDCLESLVGFPSDVAKLMWDRAVKFGLISNEDQVNPFLEAYPDLIATSINLSYNLRLINELDSVLLTILCHSQLYSLDLTGCMIGDDHDVLKALWKLKGLQELNLCHNNLSRRGLRTLALPRKGVTMIKTLDLSLNPKIMPQDYSTYVTDITQNIIIDGENNSKIIDELQKSGFVLRNRPNLIAVHNIGWCKSLFEKMIKDLTVKDHEKRANVQKKGNFYRNTSRILSVPNNQAQKNDPCNKVMLSKNLKRLGTHESASSSDSKRKCNNVRKEDLEDLNFILSMYN